MALWQFDFMIIPKGRSVENYDKEQLISWININVSMKKISHLAKILPNEKSWNSNIIQYGNLDSTCVELLTEGNQIEEISCRLDLRDIEKNVIERIINFVKSIEGEILYQGQIYNADVRVLAELIQNSSAAKFCTNPRNYFEKFENSLDQ